MAGYRHATRYSYQALFYCCPVDRQTGNPLDKAIRLTQWCKDNNYTPKQARTLLRKNYLLGKKYKGVMFVTPNPNADFNELDTPEP